MTQTDPYGGALTGGSATPTTAPGSGLPTPPGYQGGPAGPPAPITRTLIGSLPKGYEPQTFATGVAQPTNPQQLAQSSLGFPSQLNEFGTAALQPQYYSGDEYLPVHKTPGEIEQLQSRLVEAGLLNVNEVRPGRWDAKSADAYKTLLALANHGGGTDHDALNWLIANPTIAQQRAALKAKNGPAIQIENAANVTTAFQNSAQSLTGGDLPPSEADSFLQLYRQSEMQAAGARETGGTYQSPMTPEAYIQTHDPGAIHAYEGLSRYLEFLRMLHVSI